MLMLRAGVAADWRPCARIFVPQLRLQQVGHVCPRSRTACSWWTSNWCTWKYVHIRTHGEAPQHWRHLGHGTGVWA